MLFRSDISGFNDRPADMKLDAAENIIVCGRTNNGNDDDLLVLKVDPNGSPLWLNAYVGAAAGNDRASALVVDASGDIYISGKTDSDPSTTVTNYDFCTVKFNSAGVQQWVQTFNGTGNLTDEANAICLNNAGSVIVTGRSDGTVNPLISDYGIKKIGRAHV